VDATTYGALLDAVRGVHWPARGAVVGGVAGTHHSRQRGTSAEFTEYRLYRQGDDPRRLDWRLLARSDRAYIRLATNRAHLTTMFVVDASASMAFPSTSQAKWRRARELAVGLAAVAHGDGDPVGVAIGGDGRRALSPRTRRGVVGEIARVVDGSTPAGAAPLAPIVAPLRAGRIAIVTDLLGDADDLLAAARLHAAAGREVHLVHVIAREELEPPRRPMLAADPERPTVQRLLIDADRGRYRDAFSDWRTDMARRWRAAGAVYVESVTDEDAARAVRRVAGSARMGVPSHGGMGR
jgi:uncharacterized protein (DUF58 family)